MVMATGLCRRWIRAFALSWGVLQFALPLVILLGDAETALRAAREAYVHVESNDAKGCVPVHADECVLCRFLSDDNAPPPRHDRPAVVASAGPAPADAPPIASYAVSRRLPASRGPPIA